jgi:hypothetical protein
MRDRTGFAGTSNRATLLAGQVLEPRLALPTPNVRPATLLTEPAKDDRRNRRRGHGRQAAKEQVFGAVTFDQCRKS